MILVVAFQAGSARALEPVVKEWKRKTGEPIEIYAFDQASPIFEQEGWITNRVTEVEEIFKKSSWPPRLLLTGTSWYPEIEASLWQKASAANLPSIAVLDNWGELSRRFTSPVGAIPYNSLPTRIAVMDEWTRCKMIEEGCPSHILSVTGQPALDYFENAEAFSQEKARKALGQGSENTSMVLFVNEAIVSFGQSLAFGYTDETVLVELLKALDLSGWTDASLVVKLHPAETVNRAPSLLAAYPGRKSCVVSGDGRQWAAAADVVVGMTSILLLEAALMGRHVCSHRPNALEPSPMVEAYQDYIKQTSSIAELTEWLIRVKRQTEKPQRRSTSGAALHVTSLMQTCLAEGEV